MKTIVLSGINLFEGGPLSVYKDCLDSIVKSGLHQTYKIIAFVYKNDMYAEYSDKVTLIELPKSKSNYLYRLWYEYIYFYSYSKNANIDIWISLHDVTPNVIANKRYVYCHNPSIFLKLEFKNIKYGYKIFLFSVFYKYLYKINIHKNTAVIVQQDWIRDSFIQLFKLHNVIVARPIVIIDKLIKINKDKRQNNKCQFIYPAYPRFFKNIEVICDACKSLEENGITNFEVLLTLDGTENKYSADLKNKYGKLKTVNFIGIQKREKIFELYNQVDCLIFSSYLETWGLPISEFKGTHKPIFVADLPYAKETLGTYDKVCFFEYNDSNKLSELIINEINKINIYVSVTKKILKKPYANGWDELFKIIVS